MAGADHRLGGEVAAAGGVGAAEHDVARFVAGHEPREAGAVERGVGAGVAADRTGAVAEQDDRGGGVGGDGQHFPAVGGVAGVDVAHQVAVDFARRGR